MTTQQGLVKINGSYIILAHTICASTAFIAALIIGYSLHFHKIVTNAHYTYPDEWWPSVSATIGDRYPERSVFQILIALTAFPRFCLLITHYFLTKSVSQFLVGFVRTVTCGGWVYITSTDDHDFHDIFMISYIILTLPWNILCIKNSNPETKRYKLWGCIAFFTTLVPLVYWFIQHDIYHRAGAYSIYAYIEWSLIVQDILFDALSFKDFKEIDIIFALQGVQFFKTDGKPETKLQLSEKETLVRENIEEDDLDYVPEEQEFTEKDEDEDDEEISETEISEIKKEVAELLEEAKDIELSETFFNNNLHFVIIVYHSFLFWTSLTALMCIIWHFPLWYMGISGYEAAILFVLLSVLMYLPYASNIMYQYGSLLITIISIGSYLVSVPEKRLMTIGFGVGLSCMNLVYYMNYVLHNRSDVTKFNVAWCLGLTLSVVLKMGNYSNNPLWPIMFEENGGWNKTGLFVCGVLGMVSPTLFKYSPTRVLSKEQKNIKGIKRFLQILFISLGFGSLLFATHQLVTDASTLIYWSWEGYQQNEAPILHWPWSSVICFVMVISSLLNFWPVFQNKVVTSAFLIGATYVLVNPEYTSFSNYFYGGIPYVIGIVLSYQYYFQHLFMLQSVAAFTLGFFIYILFVLAHVWTVAYAFVPYGWVLRERLDYVLVISTISILLGIGISNNNYFSKNDAKLVVNKYNFKKVCVQFSLLLTLIIGGFTYFNRLYNELPQPYHENSNLLTAGIWTIHFGLDNDMWASEQRMIDLIQDMELDVVGLLESDTQRITMGNRDLTNKMASTLNMYADYGPGPNKHTWGCALLSKFPILNSTHHLLPSPVGELAPAIHATLDMYGELVDVFVFHSGQEEDEEDRRLQSEKMARLMGSVPEGRPTVLLSYLVTDPHTGNYNTYVSETSGMHDIEPEDDDRWCEYILYKNLKRVGYARVNRGTITDTELQVGKFQILSQKELKEYGEELIYQNNKVDSLHDDDLKFPDMFLEDGERGHYYHVFDRPYYYSFDLGYVDELDDINDFDDSFEEFFERGIR